MILHGAINLDLFERQILTEYDPAAILGGMLADISHGAKMTIAKLIF